MLTTTRQPQQATHLITLDKQLNKLGSLLNIEPGEQFKASRFMGDKLYLVTFEQIDPLFVVDLASVSTPKIIGELKIPGYSTYLHPWAPEANGVQRLL
ncbi:beta-propeller domain-containing protein [Patescibacteria group bacterium]|nr:beta-propeller domain-containing protein [Patescibacteria group bacterium]